MLTLSSTEQLTVWEQGLRLHPLDRSLLLLSAVYPDVSHADLADWPVGRRNRAIAEWLSNSAGSRLSGSTTCPQCDEQLELELDTRLLLDMEQTDPESRVVVGGQAFRLPTSRDVARAAAEEDGWDAVTCLLEACRVNGDGHSLSKEEVEELGERIGLADPLAETVVTLRCPECNAESDQPLDITTFAWAELESRAHRLLLEIHQLASAYGWTDADVLALSEPRRAFFLEATER